MECENSEASWEIEQVTHAMVGITGTYWDSAKCAGKIFGELSTDNGLQVYFSGEEDRHEYGIGFLMHKDMVSAVLGCRPVSSRLISIRLRAAPFTSTSLSYRFKRQQMDTMTVRLNTSTSNYRKP